MTAQIGDIYEHEGAKYSCVAEIGESYFDPRKYGFEPTQCSSACWRGFYCEYEINDSKLKLQTLHIYDKNDNYPELNGVSIIPIEYETDELYNGTDWIQVKVPYDGFQTYNNLNLVIEFTGKILLASGFIDEYYVHMGFQEPYGFETLLSVEFEHGMVKEIVDHGETARLLRKICEDKKKKFFIEEDELYNTLPEEIRKTIWWKQG